MLLLDIGERIGAVFLTVQENNAMLNNRQAETNIIEWLGLLVFNVGNFLSAAFYMDCLPVLFLSSLCGHFNVCLNSVVICDDNISKICQPIFIFYET